MKAKNRRNQDCTRIKEENYNGNGQLRMNEKWLDNRRKNIAFSL